MTSQLHMCMCACILQKETNKVVVRKSAYWRGMWIAGVSFWYVDNTHYWTQWQLPPISITEQYKLRGERGRESGRKGKREWGWRHCCINTQSLKLFQIMCVCLLSGLYPFSKQIHDRSNSNYSSNEHKHICPFIIDITSSDYDLKYSTCDSCIRKSGMAAVIFISLRVMQGWYIHSITVTIN